MYHVCTVCVYMTYVCIVVHDISNNNINIIHSFPENIQVTYMSCTYESYILHTYITYVMYVCVVCTYYVFYTKLDVVHLKNILSKRS